MTSSLFQINISWKWGCFCLSSHQKWRDSLQWGRKIMAHYTASNYTKEQKKNKNSNINKPWAFKHIPSTSDVQHVMFHYSGSVLIDRPSDIVEYAIYSIMNEHKSYCDHKAAFCCKNPCCKKLLCNFINKLYLNLLGIQMVSHCCRSKMDVKAK